MNRCLIALSNLFIICFAYAYDENSMPDLAVPTQIPANSLEANIVHRFFRIPGGEFPDNFINLANVKLGVRYVPLPKIEVGTSFQFYKKEYTFHGAYSLFIPEAYLRTQARVQFYGANNDLNPRFWDRGLLCQINLQSEPIAGLFLPVVDVAYDGRAQKMGLGTGLDIAVTKAVDLLGEYYPVLGTRDLTFDGKPKVNCFSAGIKLTTMGHHFMFVIANNYDIGMRRLMRGADNNTIYYGFNIQRLFSW